MEQSAPIMLVDFCGVRDKYDLLAELASEIAPRPLVVVDGLRNRTNELTPIRGGEFTHIAAPSQIFRSSAWSKLTNPFRRYLLPQDDDLVCLASQLTAMRQERDSGARHEDAIESLKSTSEFTDSCLRKYRPDLIIIWNQFHPLSRAAQVAARRREVRVAFMEYGLLPGTLNFDLHGQMGESDIVQKASEFQALQLDFDDVHKANSVLAALRWQQTNRRTQTPLGTAGRRLIEKANGRPIVLFAGHNDHASGTTPYDDRARRFHSPVFESSRQAADYLATIARENEWFLVYKPHPFAVRAQRFNEGDHVTLLADYDINSCIDLADCVVTTVSQASYVALLRRKPLVMIGYNQLRGSGCHYQVESRQEVRSVLKSAIANGFTTGQQTAWSIHVARLLKYYLYSFAGHAPRLEAARSPTQLAKTIHDALLTAPA
ncbi:capsular polysaccharide export protein, LipB/KpsS family [Sinorhizobium fredii]|uniref:capsular polysaccharide export protein, LipB/KpsS family n=1 Tax=Rhizobium fredii TaxID=380 RepID=UPI00210C5235|nr:hypothetical protein [Sinorhizobium fredii]UTY46684.1 hypothetical protein EPK84_07405 [Sinorhizobium fredii]